MCESFKCPDCGFEKPGSVGELLAWAKRVGYEEAERELKPLIAELQRKLQTELDDNRPVATVTQLKPQVRRRSA